MERLQQLNPDYLADRSRKLHLVCDASAITIIALPLSILIAWLIQARWMETLLPAIFEMKVNAAFGFIALGGGLFALSRARPRAAAGLAALALLVGALTLLEYLGLAIPIDQLLVRDWSALPGAYPGRAAPNTAAVFVLSGAAIIILALIRHPRARGLALWLGPFTIIAVALETIAGHVGGSAFALGWLLQPMSIPSALCALILAAGLLAYGWRNETAAISHMPLWAPALYCFAVALLDVYIPLDINIGICYIPLVLCALWFERANMVFALATVATLLVVFGLFASPPGRIAFEGAAANRGLDVLCIWVLAALVHRQHLARRRLRYTEHHFIAAQRLAAIGSFELTFKTLALSGSDAFEAMHDLPPGQPRDWPTFLRNAIPPDERDAMEQMIAASRAGQRPRDLEYSFLRADGTVRNGVMHCDLVRDAGGAPTGIIGVVHDVTELRRAQAQQGDIEVQQRHAQKLETLGMLAGGIAHDLNNTLVPITTLTPLLMESASGNDLRVFEVIMDAARRAKQLVREMLVFSRKDESPREPIRLDLLVRESLTIIRAGIPATITIVDQLEPVPEILASKGQIYQTILNLATNAAHAIGDRAGTITIGANCEDRGPVEPPDVRLFVSDDGDGMDPTTARRVFEPYFSTRPAASGSGLGLSIVNGIVKNHGGSIVVRSAVGQGTRFDLLFPAGTAPATP